MPEIGADLDDQAAHDAGDAGECCAQEPGGSDDPADIDAGIEDYPSLREVFLEHLEKFRERVAYVSIGTEMTYADWHMQGIAFAAWLQGQGVKTGDRVALMMPNCLQYPICLLGTILAGWIPVEIAGVAVVLTAIIGYFTGRQVPPAPPMTERTKLDYNFIRASIALIKATMKVKRVFLAIIAISFFWGVGAVLGSIFPPMVKNAIGGDNTVATLFTAFFSIGIAIGSVAINRLLNGTVSAKYAPASVIVMGLFVLDLWWTVSHWQPIGSELIDWWQFLTLGYGERMIVDLLGISIAGGMFVVPLYAFLTTTVAKSQTARTIAANNIVNSGAMVIGAVIYSLLVSAGVGIADTLFMIAAACLVSAWISWKLHKACDPVAA